MRATEPKQASQEREARGIDPSRLFDVGAPESPRARRLRVVHCIDGLGIGGTELNMVRTLEQLDRSRFDLSVVALNPDGPLRARVDASAVPVLGLPMPNMYGFRALRQFARLVSHFRRLRPDVVHCHDCYSNIFASAAAHAARVPTIITSRRWWDVLPSRAHAIANRLAYRASHRVLANSEAVARLVREHENVAADRVVVVPNFLEDDAFEEMADETRQATRRELRVPPTALVVGCVAKLRPEKDLATLLRAVAALGRQATPVHLVLVGDGPCESELRTLAGELELGDRVHFAGFRPNRPNLHALFDISVLCSLHEGFPNTIIEAMAVGRPVVATDVGGVADVVEHDRSGLLVPAGRPDRLAIAIESLAVDADRREAFGAAGRARVSQHFRAAPVLARLESVYLSGV